LTSAEVDDIPQDGRTVYVRLFYKISGVKYYKDYVFETGMDGFVLRLDGIPQIPALENGSDPAEKYTGAAAAQMVLTHLWWNRNDYPQEPPALTDAVMSSQEELYQHGVLDNYSVNAGLERLDVQGLWSLLQNFDPEYAPYHYNWKIQRFATQEESLSAVCERIAYAAGGGSDNPDGYGVDGYPVHVPAVVPTGGNYDRWVVVTGIRTTDDPLTSDSYGIYGFWIQDPYVSGIGENTYVTAEAWAEENALAMTGVDINDPNYNQWVVLVDPPAEGGEAVVLERHSRKAQAIKAQVQLSAVEVDGIAQYVYSRSTSAEEESDLVRAAVEGIEQEILPYDSELSKLYEDAAAGRPLFVDNSSGSDYYLVPFVQDKDAQLQMSGVLCPDYNGTVIVAVIDAQTGVFKQATWVSDPRKFLPVSKREALYRLKDYLGLETIHALFDGAEVELIHENNSSIYAPVWLIVFEGAEYRIDQHGNITE